MGPVRIGLLGAGRIAQTAHLPALAQASGAQLSCLHDPSPLLAAGVADRYGVGACATVGQLLGREDVDAVLICTPDRTHRELASAALAAGKHVLVEKPMTSTAADGEELAREVSARQLVLQVGFMKRHDPGVRYAAQAVRERIGRVLSASLWYRVMAASRPDVEANHSPPVIVDEAVRELERAAKADASRYLLDTHGSHVLDSVRHLVGDPAAVSAREGRVGDDRTWHVEGLLPDGGLVHAELSVNVHGPWDEGAVIHGEHGTVRLRTHFPLLLLASDVEVFVEGRGTVERPVHAAGNAYRRQIEAFAEAVRTGSRPEPDAWDGLAALRLVDAVRRSVAARGEAVSLAG